MENNDEQKHFIIKNEIKTRDERIQKIKDFGLRSLKFAGGMVMFASTFPVLKTGYDYIVDENFIYGLPCLLAGAYFVGVAQNIMKSSLDKDDDINNTDNVIDANVSDEEEVKGRRK